MTSDASLEVQRALGRIEGKLDESLKQAEATTLRINNHGERIGHLERFKSRAIGYGAGAAAVLGAIVTVLKLLK